MHDFDDTCVRPTLGWREWVGLPAIGIHEMKAKVDTGARTSALHAFQVERMGDEVLFRIHPHQFDNDQIVECRAEIQDIRPVRDSGGHSEERYVIRTPIRLGDQSWDIELTLTSRDDMRFRMLLGRTAIRGKYAVDPSRSYLVGKRRRRAGRPASAAQ